MTSLGVPDGVKVLTVGELSREVKGLLEDAFPSVWVSGEVSNLSRPASGHVYLTLKDQESQFRSVLYRGVALRLRFDLQNGMEVVARGRVNVYLPRGEYQLSIEELHPKGIGALDLAFQQLREKLFARGYFDPGRKKPLPRFPQRVALVTSPTGAAVRDMLEILGRRWPALEVWVCPVHVQGDGAAEEIAEAVRRLNRLDGIDVIIVGRGGGSLEDLWAFNEECVARAIYESRIPVVSGVGHETDLTISDLVADVRALTPSDAALRVAPDRQEIAEGLRASGNRLRTALVRRVELVRARLEDLAGRRCFRQPLDRVREAERRLDETAERLRRVGSRCLERLDQRIQTCAARLQTLSPLNVLARGYSLTRRENDGVVVRSPSQVQPGDCLLTDVQGGRVRSRVE
jgi:exodeoxyribonuclease VII large subunit